MSIDLETVQNFYHKQMGLKPKTTFTSHINFVLDIVKLVCTMQLFFLIGFVNYHCTVTQRSNSNWHQNSYVFNTLSNQFRILRRLNQTILHHNIILNVLNLMDCVSDHENVTQ